MQRDFTQGGVWEAESVCGSEGLSHHFQKMAAMECMLALVGTSVKAAVTEPAQRSARRPAPKLEYPVLKQRSSKKAKQAPSDITNLHDGNGRGRSEERANRPGERGASEQRENEVISKEAARIKMQYRDVLKKSMGGQRDRGTSVPGQSPSVTSLWTDSRDSANPPSTQVLRERAAAAVPPGRDKHSHNSNNGDEQPSMSYKDVAKRPPAVPRSSSLPSVKVPSSAQHRQPNQLLPSLSTSAAAAPQRPPVTMLPAIPGPRSAPSGAGRAHDMNRTAPLSSSGGGAGVGEENEGGGGGARRDEGELGEVTVGVGGGALRVPLRERNRSAPCRVDEEAEAERQVVMLAPTRHSHSRKIRFAPVPGGCHRRPRALQAESATQCATI